MIIKIFGSKNEGKTTIAELISKTLKEHNIEVINEDQDISQISLEQRLKILGNETDGLKCKIKTIPLKLETRPKYASDFDGKK